MKKFKLYLVSILSLLLFSSGISDVISDGWRVKYDPQTRTVEIKKGDRVVYNDLYATYKLSDKLVSSKDYRNVAFSQSKVKNSFGKGKVLTITYTDDKLPTMVQSFYVYPSREYVLTDFVLESKSEISSNYMAPVNIDAIIDVLQSSEKRVLFVPFDNDAWVRYKSYPYDFKNHTSFEVTAIFDNKTREGLVIGSVEHDNWKTGVTIKREAKESLVCYGGITDALTRDKLPHGALKGTSIKSPMILLGLFDDWRKGMEAYADANAVIAPPMVWSEAMPVGWNSWGALQFNLTYTKALEVSDYFKNELQPNNFTDTNGSMIVWLDSGWNAFSEQELKSFVERCEANGQTAGIYWTPFADWGKNPNRGMDYAPNHQYKDVYLYNNGQPQDLDGAYAVDPTHPAIEEQMKVVSSLFRRTGFKYVKMDFMTHGALESDKWHNPNIRTGIQGYNYGMKLLNKYFGDMYVNLSISPIFPAQYAQSRRIACDAWNKMKDTEYSLNALSYGWWQDRIYSYNDADHIVLRDATEGENRARITSGVITGIYIVGDDFSIAGDTAVKARARAFLTNAEVNSVAKGRSFYPVEGDGAESENQFVLKTDKGELYYAIFNYYDQPLKETVSMERIGLNAKKDYTARELWSGREQSVKRGMELTVPAKDVFLFKITKK